VFDRDAMSTAHDVQEQSTVREATTTLELALPVHNEERDLERSVRRLRHYLDTRFPVATVVTIADNASTDATWSIAEQLAEELEGVRAVRVDRKGRGRALREVWSASRARVVAYMDKGGPRLRLRRQHQRNPVLRRLSYRGEAATPRH
jgi:cellulose synthase/poly-beta-1,6-N-acetylglucosamine synthase-like glycosyltransferase